MSERTRETSPHWCVNCFQWCPGHAADGYCLLVDRAELARREVWLRTGTMPAAGSAVLLLTVPNRRRCKAVAEQQLVLLEFLVEVLLCRRYY